MKNTERELATDYTDSKKEIQRIQKEPYHEGHEVNKEIQNKNTERWMPACAGMTSDVDNAKVWG